MKRGVEQKGSLEKYGFEVNDPNPQESIKAEF